MTEQPTPANPIVARRQTSLVPKMERGSPLARAQLEDHVAMLNRMDWVRASGKPYLVCKIDNERLGIMREGERTTAPGEA
jgi:hypothetical protein